MGICFGLFLSLSVALARCIKLDEEQNLRIRYNMRTRIKHK